MSPHLCQREQIRNGNGIEIKAKESDCPLSYEITSRRQDPSRGQGSTLPGVGTFTNQGTIRNFHHVYGSHSHDGPSGRQSATATRELEAAAGEMAAAGMEMAAAAMEMASSFAAVPHSGGGNFVNMGNVFGSSAPRSGGRGRRVSNVVIGHMTGNGSTATGQGGQPQSSHTSYSSWSGGHGGGSFVNMADMGPGSGNGSRGTRHISNVTFGSGSGRGNGGNGNTIVNTGGGVTILPPNSTIIRATPEDGVEWVPNSNSACSPS